MPLVTCLFHFPNPNDGKPVTDVTLIVAKFIS